MEFGSRPECVRAFGSIVGSWGIAGRIDGEIRFHPGAIGHIGRFAGAVSGIFIYRSSLLRSRPEKHHKTLCQIIDSPALPSPLAKAISTKALVVGSGTQGPASKTACRSLLSMLRERQPTVVDTAALEIPDVDPELIERPEEETTMLNLLSADVTARVDGINALLAPHLLTGGKDMTIEEKENLRSSVLSRLGDNDVQVLDALYKSAKHREVIAHVCAPADITEVLRPVFHADRFNEEILRRHLAFVCNNLVKVHPKAKDEVFEILLFPILLSTKGRTLSEATFEVIKNSTLGGTSETVKAVCSVDLTIPTEVAKSIAGMSQVGCGRPY